jgi:hypothetical protein
MGASIRFNNDSSSVECLVRNISQSGARLSVSPAVGLPQTFSLLIPQKGLSREARLIWRSETEVGVAFVVPAAVQSDPEGEAVLRRRVRELERELAQLQSRIIELSAG